MPQKERKQVAGLQHNALPSLVHFVVYHWVMCQWLVPVLIVAFIYIYIYLQLLALIFYIHINELSTRYEMRCTCCSSYYAYDFNLFVYMVWTTLYEVTLGRPSHSSVICGEEMNIKYGDSTVLIHEQGNL